MTAPWKPTFPVTPWNTWSNLAYPLAGFTHFALQPSWPAFALALWQTGLGYGSYRYHAKPSAFTNRLDWTPMYGVQGFLATVAWFPAEPWIALSASILAALLALFFVWRFKKVFKRFDWHMGVLFLLAFIPAYLWGDRSAALWSAGLFAAAFGLWQMERHQMFDGGHGWWHVLTAIAQSLLLVARTGQ